MICTITFMLSSTSLVTKQPMILYCLYSLHIISDAAPIAVENSYFQEFYNLKMVHELMLVLNIYSVYTGLLGGEEHL